MRRRTHRRGFTLVELMVSLVAGLIIAIAVVGLAKAATTTFHEQARISQVEASVRSAAERIRQDLTRISYMSTGNITLALANVPPPGFPRAPYGQRVGNDIGTNTGSRYASTIDLAGIRVRVGGSRAASALIPPAGSEGPNNLATNNQLNPDAIIITGNLTSDDNYFGTWMDAGTCGGVRIDLDPAFDASVRRLLDPSMPPLAAVQAAFMPIAGVNYLARIVDKVGCQHYAEVCNVTVAGTRAQIHFADAPTGNAIPANGAAAGGAGDCGGARGDNFTVSPVHRVRYYIGPNLDAALDPVDPDIDPAGNKFNLYREMLDANGAALPAPGVREIVAEYAYDLKFGLVVDDPAVPAPNNVRVFDMDTDPGGGPVDTWTQTPSTTIVGGPGPQRVRAVRFRVATRAALPDRRAPLQVLPVPGQPYITRYCTENASINDCTRFARSRTIVSEVTLMNQLGMTY
ncbi:MAG: type II secretion system protein [Labilithrix sp.]|nr:type II secretion system protein [Labilithrix sp.]